MKKLDCSSCWAPCCRAVDKVPEMNSYDRGDGACRHLRDDNSCEIYDNRPDICKVEVMWQKLHGDMPWDLYKFLSDQACDQLRRYLVDRKPKT